ncbi:MAG: hypothetical protein M3P49_09995 [Actinomycetota bacterium]|nr:hypothetical protein [Actinomycetota bacterium]
MEPPLVFSILAAILVLCLAVLLLPLLGRKRHKMTKAGLRKRALEASEALVEAIDEREASRPANDTVITDHEYSHRRVTLHDEETQRIYARDHLPEIADLREQFAKRGIRNDALDRLYEDALNEGDLRTVSTALGEMAKALR